MVELHQYPNPDELFEQCAKVCIAALKHKLKSGPASLVVSGGTTPAPLFERLANTDMSWQKVTILPSDERWLATDHSASNEKLIREHLLKNNAAEAKVQSLKLDFPSAELAQEALDEQLADVMPACAVAIVGMGLDGHFASLFPDTPQTPLALDITNKARCSAIDATGCSVAGQYTERMTLTLSALLEAERVILLFKGEDKLELVKSVLADEPVSRQLPVYQLLHQDLTPVDIYCA